MTVTKKGRCLVSGNGPLTFPRQLDVVADAFIAAWAFDLGLQFPKYAVNSGIPEHAALSRRETAGRHVVASRCARQVLNLPHTSDYWWLQSGFLMAHIGLVA